MCVSPPAAAIAREFNHRHRLLTATDHAVRFRTPRTLASGGNRTQSVGLTASAKFGVWIARIPRVVAARVLDQRPDTCTVENVTARTKIVLAAAAVSRHPKKT
jgi:hypothetical protein